MKKLKWLAGLASFLFASQSFADQATWNLRAGDDLPNTAHRVVVDVQNDVLVLGTFEDTISFDPNDPNATLNAPKYANGVFLTKLDINGKHLWSKALLPDSASGDIYMGDDIATDSLARSFVTGMHVFQNSLNIAGMVIKPNTGGSFVASLDQNGNPLWVQHFGNSNKTRFFSITSDDQGYVYAAGKSNGELGLVCEKISPDFSVPNNGTRPFLIKLDANTGDCIWFKQWPVVNAAIEGGFIYRVRVDSEGKIVFVGQTSYAPSSIDFGNGPIDFSFASPNASTVFIVRLDDKDGSAIWSKKVGGGFTDLAVDDYGNSIGVGTFVNQTFFDNITMTPLYPPNQQIQKDSFVVKFDSNGKVLWARQFAESSGFNTHDQALTGVSVDSLNEQILVTGKCRDSVKLNTPGINKSVFCSPDNDDVFVERMNFDGLTQTATAFGGPENDQGTSIVQSWASNRMFLVGDFILGINFGLGPIWGAGQTNTDVFVTGFDDPNLPF